MHLNDALHHLIPDVTLLELRDGRVATFIEITGVADRSVVVYEVDTSPDKKQRQRHGVGASGFWSRDSAIQHANDVVAVKCIDPRPASPSGDLSAELAAVRRELANTKQVAESMTNECQRLKIERDEAYSEVELLTARLDERSNAVATTTHNMQEACRVKALELEKAHSELTTATWERDEARRANHDIKNELKDARVRIDDAYQSRLLTCINMLKSALCGHVNADTALGAEWNTLLAQVHELRARPLADEVKSARDAAFDQGVDRVLSYLEKGTDNLNMGDTVTKRLAAALDQRMVAERNLLKLAHRKDLDELGDALRNDIANSIERSFKGERIQYHQLPRFNDALTKIRELATSSTQTVIDTCEANHKFVRLPGPFDAEAQGCPACLKIGLKAAREELEQVRKEAREERVQVRNDAISASNVFYDLICHALRQNLEGIHVTLGGRDILNDLLDRVRVLTARKEYSDSANSAQKLIDVQTSLCYGRAAQLLSMVLAGDYSEIHSLPPCADPFNKELWALVNQRTNGSLPTPALKSVALERSRHLALGKTPAVDDKHTDGFLTTLAIAKACRRCEGPAPRWVEEGISHLGSAHVFNGTPRQLLVEAAACLVADIERLDRIDVRKQEEKVVALKKEVAAGEMAAKELAALNLAEQMEGRVHRVGVCGLLLAFKDNKHLQCTLPFGHAGGCQSRLS
jgi:hypothetical protein